MANPTIYTLGFQKHVRLRAPYRTNTLTELSARIIGSSARLRGFDFVSENPGVDVTLGAGDFISVGAALDLSQPARASGIIVRTTGNSVIDTSGFTDPTIWGFAADTVEPTPGQIEFLVTEAGAAPGGAASAQYAPLIFKSGGDWFPNRAIGNDSLGSTGVLASGTGTTLADPALPVTITHNLNIASYRVFLQPINQTNYNTSPDLGTLAGPVAGILYPLNQTANTFDVINSGGNFPCDFNWMVVV
jgi:hypothetical protein